MAYEVYIKKAYKAEIIWAPKHPLRSYAVRFPVALVFGVVLLALMGMRAVSPMFEADIGTAVERELMIPELSQALPGIDAGQEYTIDAVDELSLEPMADESRVPGAILDDSRTEAVVDEPSFEPMADESPPAPGAILDESYLATVDESHLRTALDEWRLEPGDEVKIELQVEPSSDALAHIPQWREVTVRQGDTFASILSRFGINPHILYRIVNIDETAAALKSITPGQVMKFDIDNDELKAMRYEMDLTRTLSISKVGGVYQADILVDELRTETKYAHGVIDHSLFSSGKDAGLSDNLIMKLVSIYGWDIDFALDIRQGDKFTVIYQEQYKNELKVGAGPILAAEFVNQNKVFRAVRYEDSSGHSDYYSEGGHAMRKTFLRTPVNFTRISSKFNMRRKHPVLNTIRAHRGVDYAAPVGTPVKVTSGGVIDYIGRKGGYGKTIIIQHGTKYSTVYAHLSAYKGKKKVGDPVKQGEIIGYVGTTGLSTGPHLHYEFRINGAHHNPLTVELSRIEKIPEQEFAKFKKTVGLLLAELDLIAGNTSVALSTDAGASAEVGTR